MTLLALLAISMLLVSLMNQCQSTREFLRKVCPINRHTSFFLDIPLLLPLVGLLVEVAARRIKSHAVTMSLLTVIGFTLFSGGILTGNDFIVLIGLLLSATTLWSDIRTKLSVRQIFYVGAIGVFMAVSGSLYLDHFNFFVLTPFLGHPEAWGGNHFMWNSGIEVLGLKPLVDTTVPTYKNFFGFLNILGMTLFAFYPIVMVLAGTRLHGILFGYTEKQTGITPLIWESRKKNS